MACKWGKLNCKNFDEKCYLCNVEGYYYVSSTKKMQQNRRLNITKRQGAMFEARNHINVVETLDVTSRMTPNSGAGRVKGEISITLCL